MDNYLITPSGKSKRLLTRLAVKNLFIHFSLYYQLKMSCSQASNTDENTSIFMAKTKTEYGNPLVDNNEAKRSYEYFSSKSDDDLYIGGESLSFEINFKG